MRHDVIEALVKRHIPENAYAEQWNTTGLTEEVKKTLGLDLPLVDWAKEEGIADEEIKDRLMKAADAVMDEKATRFGPEIMAYIEKAVLLQTLDGLWREHLVTLEHLRQVIGFRGYAQRDPLQEYKTEAFELFQTLLTSLRERVTAQMMRVEVMTQDEAQDAASAELPPMQAMHANPVTGRNEFADAEAALFGPGGLATPVPSGFPPAAEIDPNDPNTWGKVGRNAPCPCGSGKKYKHCHGTFA
jgi:preprotein translocase subunit SecA